MSYNIDSVDTPVREAWMLAKDVLRIYKEHKGELPEGCFLEELVEIAREALVEADDPKAARVTLGRMNWYGDGSGHSYEDVFVPHVAPKIMGRVDMIFTWEGGDSHSGLRIEDGVVTECDVVMTLKPKEKKA